MDGADIGVKFSGGCDAPKDICKPGDANCVTEKVYSSSSTCNGEPSTVISLLADGKWMEGNYARGYVCVREIGCILTVCMCVCVYVCVCVCVCVYVCVCVIVS